MSPSLQLLHDRALEQAERVRAALDGLNDEQFNRSPDQAAWSIGSILQHLALANRPYLSAIELALKEAPAHPGDVTPELSLFGKVLLKASGPGGNAPAPKALQPGPGPWPLRLVEDFASDQRRIANLIRLAARHDINRAKFPNPFIGLIKMRVSDGFAILVEHSERHVRQIEDRRRWLTPPDGTGTG